jgi:hypothetical protein
MPNKKITLFLLSLFFCLNAVNAQKKSGHSVKYKWAGGIGIGVLHVNGDVPAVKTQLQQTLNVYKPFANWFALRFSYTHGNAKGMHWLASNNFAKNSAWASKYAAPVRMPNGVIAFGYTSNGVFTPAAKADAVYYNYKTAINNIAVSAQFTLPIPFNQPKVGIYVLAGAGALFYNAKVNASSGSGTYAGLFNQLASGMLNNKKEILKALKNGMDNSYETNAEYYSKQPHFTQHFGLGFSYKFKKRFEAGLERCWTYIKTDLLDGQRWQEHAYGDAVLTRDFDGLVISTVSIKYFF